MNYKSCKPFLEGLEELEKLTGLEARGCNIPFKMNSPLSLLFDYAKKRMAVAGRDRNLPEGIKRRGGIPDKALKWVEDTDKKHTVASFGYLIEICGYVPRDYMDYMFKKKYTDEERKKVLSAMIVHDCAYPTTRDFADFTSKATRIKHMQNGAEAFKTFASVLNKSFEGFYSSQEIDDIADIVSKHDNPGMDISFDSNDPQLRLLLAHREADRLWMLDKAGFALDLVRRIVEEDRFEPEKYLAHVVSKHMKEPDAYATDPGFKTFLGKKTLYTTETGYEIFRRLLDERMQDYDITVVKLGKILDKSGQKVGARASLFEEVMNSTVKTDDEIVDTAYSDPRSTTSQSTIKARELFTPIQIECLANMLNVGDKHCEFTLESMSNFSASSSSGKAKLFMYYERDGQKHAKKLFDDYTPQSGIHNVKFQK